MVEYVVFAAERLRGSSERQQKRSKTLMDPTHGTYEHGIGFGEGPNQQDRTVWDLRPDGDGPPIKVKMAVVDATQVVKNFPNRYRYWWPGDPTPARAPMTK